MDTPEYIRFDALKAEAQPFFDSSRWHTCTDHSWEACLETSNCYAYALNQPSYHWAIPGLGYAKAEPLHVFDSYEALFGGLTPAEHRELLLDGARHDGLIAINEPAQAAGYYSVALFFSDRADYGFHWYRQDSNGTWSHKNGWRPASNQDSRGHTIIDPRQDSSSGYSIFGGFFLMPIAGIHLQPSFPLISQKQPEGIPISQPTG